MLLSKAVEKKLKVRYKCDHCCTILLQKKCHVCKSTDVKKIELYVQSNEK